MRPPQAQLRPMPWSCAHPSATMCTAAVCSTFFSTCPHLSLVATCRRDLASSSRRRLGEAEAWFQLRGGRGAYLSRPRYRPSAGVEPSGGGPPPDLHTLYARSLRLGTHVLSHPPPVRARRSAARGQCGRAELALRHRCLRCRPGGAVARAESDYLGLRLASAFPFRLLWSTSGPNGLRRRLRRRVPVNPGRRAGDAAREAAAGRAWRRATGDLPPRIPPEACWEPPQAPLRPRASPQAPPTPVHESPRPTEVP